ncbi:acetyltransferase, GNAT family [Pseudomonas chlororaphis subsp. aurantiaca]|nr:acetyltransferase, GNAT family [Pseudomonas chlororaphis subsp. aurantiaca]
MPAEPPAIVIERFSEAHVQGITALYNDPAVACQTLQTPFQPSEVWRRTTSGGWPWWRCTRAR